jgi:uncharacterized secreted protein with C-terminal beta-propeller domain
MQKEIKRKAGLYAIIASLMAIVLGSLCYNLGYIPQVQVPQASSLLKTFSSREEIGDFLKAKSKTQAPYMFLGPMDTSAGRFLSVLSPVVLAITNALESVKGYSVKEYSPTNIQVAGVDEADNVKTDGEYIYLITGNNVSILKAYPPEEAREVSKITFNDTYAVGIFVSGDRLVVLGCKYAVPPMYFNSYIMDVKTFANLYDISNKTDPRLLRTFALTGSYFNSRMIGKYVYFVVSQPSYLIFDTVILPKTYSNNKSKEIPPSEIHYSNTSDNYYVYTTFTALNMENATEEPTYITLMMGGTSNMYVSLSNVYVTFRELDDKTSIYRVHIENNNMTLEAQGKVPGRELNQFSMDEYNSYFRIATTTWTNGTAQNNLYILNMNLSVVGSLENIAPEETIDSARFIENRCYLSTSVVRRDPFFVIDVENVGEPKILGYLKIPGFIRYLHPFDESHLIGVGRDADNNVKISLFEVSNVSAPIEISKYAVDGTWSDTLVLTEHKAFLFDKTRDLLVIPVSTYYGGDYDRQVSQAAYVFNVTLNQGFELRDKITHQETGVEGGDTRYWVTRTLYIQDVLYTVSNAKVKLNSLEDLAFIKEIVLN